MNNIKCNYIVSDLLTNIKQKSDYIIFNPPFVPSNVVDKLNLSNYSKGIIEQKYMFHQKQV